MRKKVIKAHRGMAHVPKPSGQSTPTKGRGRPPTGGRIIGLPQRFRGGGGRNPLSGIIKQAPKISPKVAQPISQDSPMRQPKAPTTGNPYPKGSHNYEVYEGRGGRPSRPMPTTAIKEPSIPTTSVPKSVATERPKLTLGTVFDNRRPRRPSRPINELYRRGGRPIPLSTLLRRNRVEDSRKRQAQGMATSRGRNPRIKMSTPLIRYNGGYISRAKYGQTDNLKGKK